MPAGSKKNVRMLVINSLAAGHTQVEAAKRAGVAETTVCRWLRDPAFADAVREQQREILARSAAKLSDASTAAVATLVDLLSDQSAAIRLGAARAVLEHASRLAELVDLDHRVKAIEQALVSRAREDAA